MNKKLTPELEKNRGIYMESYNLASRSFIDGFLKKYKRDGLVALLFLGWRISLRPLKYFYLKFFQSKRKFVFRGKIHNLFYKWEGYPWETSRQIEVPIVMEYVKKFQGKSILEVGNVLSYSYNVKHKILDKYERMPGVIQEDIVDYNPEERYDLIFSVSTYEHIGFDEIKKDPKKVIRAVDNTRKLLKPRGKAVITFPLGYNPNLDNLVKNKLLGFDEIYYMERQSFNEWKSKWKEVTEEMALREFRPQRFGKITKFKPDPKFIVIGIINSDHIKGEV